MPIFNSRLDTIFYHCLLLYLMAVWSENFQWEIGTLKLTVLYSTTWGGGGCLCACVPSWKIAFHISKGTCGVGPYQYLWDPCDIWIGSDLILPVEYQGSIMPALMCSWVCYFCRSPESSNADFIEIGKIICDQPQTKLGDAVGRDLFVTFCLFLCMAYSTVLSVLTTSCIIAIIWWVCGGNL